MVDQEPLAELHQEYSADGATATLWPDARRRLEKAEVYWLSTVRV